MRLEIACFTGTSGLADYAVSLGRSIAHHARVSLVCAVSLPERFESFGFPVERVFRRSRHYPIDIFRFVGGVLRRRPDWVLVQGPLKYPFVDGLMVRLLRWRNVRCAVTVHDVLPHYPGKWSAWSYGFYYRSFAKVIAHSAAARTALGQMNVQAPILVVPHGVYDIFDLTSLTKETARRSLGRIGESDFVALFFGHLEPRKGLFEFIELARSMVDEPNMKFVIAGGNDLAAHGSDALRAFEAAKREVKNLLVWDSRIPFEQVELFFAASDVVVLPYREGSTSGVLKLALAFSKPVVATRVGDLAEQVPVDGGVVIPVEPNGVTQLREAVCLVRGRYAEFEAGMAKAKGVASWRDISSSIFEFLGEG